MSQISNSEQAGPASGGAPGYIEPSPDAERLWNEGADEFNQWTELGQDERDEFVRHLALTNPPCQ